MVVHQYVNSLSELESAIAEVSSIKITVNDQESKEPSPIFIVVSGEKDGDGKSWCSDCVKADPVLEEAFRELAPENSVVITVSLPRNEWKDKSCIFRTDSRLRLSSIPALLKWPNPQPRLEEDQCADLAALKDFFEECA